MLMCKLGHLVNGIWNEHSYPTAFILPENSEVLQRVVAGLTLAAVAVDKLLHSAKRRAVFFFFMALQGEGRAKFSV